MHGNMGNSARVRTAQSKPQPQPQVRGAIRSKRPPPSSISMSMYDAGAPNVAGDQYSPQMSAYSPSRPSLENTHSEVPILERTDDSVFRDPAVVESSQAVAPAALTEGHFEEGENYGTTASTASPESSASNDRVADALGNTGTGLQFSPAVPLSENYQGSSDAEESNAVEAQEPLDESFGSIVHDGTHDSISPNLDQDHQAERQYEHEAQSAADPAPVINQAEIQDEHEAQASADPVPASEHAASSNPQSNIYDPQPAAEIDVAQDSMTAGMDVADTDENTEEVEKADEDSFQDPIETPQPSTPTVGNNVVPTMEDHSLEWTKPEQTEVGTSDFVDLRMETGGPIETGGIGLLPNAPSMEVNLLYICIARPQLEPI